MSPEEYRHLKKEQEEMNQQRRLKRNKKTQENPRDCGMTEVKKENLWKEGLWVRRVWNADESKSEEE